MAGPQKGTVPARGLPRDDPRFATERARRKLEARARARAVRRKARGGNGGKYFDPDDPEFESMMRAYAAHTGEDPEKVLDDELAAYGRKRRKGVGSIDYLSEPAPAPASEPKTAPAVTVNTGGGLSVGDASGFALGFLLWGWVILPWVSADGVSGPTAVRNVWRAKWLNKGPNGERLLGSPGGAGGAAPAAGGGASASQGSASGMASSAGGGRVLAGGRTA